jgi:hypothetical protein
MVAADWGGSLLLDSHWIAAWLPTLVNSRTATPSRSSGLRRSSRSPLIVLDDRRSHWLMPCSNLWVPFVLLFGHAWAVALAVLAPTTALALARYYGWTLKRAQPTFVVAPGHGD